jgi:hypothetical protein
VRGFLLLFVAVCDVVMSAGAAAPLAVNNRVLQPLRVCVCVWGGVMCVCV